jgi:hypothetical protein
VKFFFVVGEPMERLDALPIVLDRFGDGCCCGVCASFMSRNVLTFKGKKVCGIRGVIWVVAFECG